MPKATSNITVKAATASAGRCAIKLRAAPFTLNVMRNKPKIRRLLALAIALVPASGFAENIDWPPLTQICFVKGRPATEDDVKKGCAAFVIKAQGKLAGVPLSIDVPQYAIHIEDGSGKETPVIVIQAEGNGGIQAVGYKVVGSTVFGASLLRELRLLGTKRPK